MGLKNFAVQKKRYPITIQRLECSETNFRVSFRAYAFNLDASDLATFYKVRKRPCPLLTPLAPMHQPTYANRHPLLSGAY